MITSTHLRLDELTAYLAEPESAETAEAARHLSRCADCRQRLSALSALKQRHPMTRPEETVAAALQSDEELRQMVREQSIERYVEGGLVGEERDPVKKKLSENRAALKAALHYARHSAAMESVLEAPAATPHETSPEASVESSATGAAGLREPPRGGLGRSGVPWLPAAVKTWLGRRIPLWSAIPASALAVCVLLLFLVSGYPLRQSRIEIALYRDNPVIRFQSPDQGPGIGFFQTAPARVAPFGDVAVSVTGAGRLEIAWPPVPQATGYRIQLTRFKNGVREPVKDRETSDTRAIFEGLEIVPGQRYVWMLSGKTADKKLFQAQGGFVCYQRTP
ncbi:MAG: fibronectin type III domain-containing protein [Desulfosarcinaceae bacterium]